MGLWGFIGGVCLVFCGVCVFISLDMYTENSPFFFFSFWKFE